MFHVEHLWAMWISFAGAFRWPGVDCGIRFTVGDLHVERAENVPRGTNS